MTKIEGEKLGDLLVFGSARKKPDGTYQGFANVTRISTGRQLESWRAGKRFLTEQEATAHVIGLVRTAVNNGTIR